MAKKVVAGLRKGGKKSFAKVIKAVKSPKNRGILIQGGNGSH